MYMYVLLPLLINDVPEYH